jgi:hypothetical protein
MELEIADETHYIRLSGECKCAEFIIILNEILRMPLLGSSMEDYDFFKNQLKLKNYAILRNGQPRFYYCGYRGEERKSIPTKISYDPELYYAVFVIGPADKRIIFPLQNWGDSIYANHFIKKYIDLLRANTPQEMIISEKVAATSKIN